MILAHQLRELSRLLLSTNYSNRRISAMTEVAPNTAKLYRQRLIEEEIGLEQLLQLNDLQLLQRLTRVKGIHGEKVMPDWPELHERRRKNKYLTLALLHEEYQAEFGVRAYKYSQFTEYYRQYCKKIDVSMRLLHEPGEALYVDYAGKLIPWKDPKTGSKYKAQVFISTMGYSGYLFMWASRSQNVEDWIQAHVRAFEFYGGLPQCVVPDNLKSAVISPYRTDNPLALNRNYQDMNRHYGVHIVPARVRKPQDKAKAEQGVLFGTRWITSRLLERQFFSLEEINTAIAELLPSLNERPLRNYPGSRQSRFEEIERAALRPLPVQPYEFGQWQAKQKVPKDYHVKVDGHFYSVPYSLVGEHVEPRLKVNTLELFHQGICVATHVRSHDVGGFTCLPGHMPTAHQAYAKQDKNHYLQWAQAFGASAIAVVESQYQGLSDRSIVANRACSNLRSIARLHETEDFELACARAIDISSPTVKSVQSILRTGLYKLNARQEAETKLPQHDNVRGASYYAQEVC